MRKKAALPLVAALAILTMVLPMVSVAPVHAAQSPQVPLPGKSIPQFVDPLPLPDLTGATGIRTIIAGASQIELRMQEFQSKMLPSTFVPAAGTYSGTWVWGYIDATAPPVAGARETYTGPVIVASRNTPTQIKYVNNLGSAATTNVLAYKYSTDQTLHWADPLGQMDTSGMIPVPGSVGASNYAGSIPAVPHLHGGEVPPVLDGGPDAWFTSDGSSVGPTYYSKDGPGPKNYAIYTYPNTQEAAPLWFHDHTLGATRLNVYAGLAGAYLLTDPALSLPAGLTSTGLSQGAGGAETLLIPLVIQDRMFDTNGQLFFPSDTAGGVQYALNPEHPYWVPEFLGDTICVNGKTWPYLNVEPRRYRFLLLNGSNARTYELSLPAPMWVIGTDGGYLDSPAPVTRLLMQPGERYDVIIDFGACAGKTLIMSNTAKSPYPKGPPPDPQTVGRTVQFRVGPAAAGFVDQSYNPALMTPIRAGAQAMVRLTNPATGTIAAGVTIQKTRQLTLNEVLGVGKTAINPVTGLATKYPGGPLEILINNTKWSGQRQIGFVNGVPVTQPVPGFTPDNFGNYLSELPNEGETEMWEIVNLTADTHPIHLHLVQFQLLNRQPFQANKYITAYNAAFPGGGYDPMTGLPYPAGVFMPGFGPPKPYDAVANLLSGGKFGGNPDVTPYLQGKISLPLPNEVGWKDTIMVNPGEVTRILVRWAPTTLPANTPPASASYSFDPLAGQREYVWHCHIVDHEDNEMMRPDQVIPNIPEASRSLHLGSDY